MRATRAVTAASNVVIVDKPDGLRPGTVLVLRRRERLDRRDKHDTLVIERMRVVGKTGHEVRVTRGIDGTEAREWPTDTGIVVDP